MHNILCTANREEEQDQITGPPSQGFLRYSVPPKESSGYTNSARIWRHNRCVWGWCWSSTYLVVVVVVLVVWQIVILLHLFLNDSRDCCITAHNICIICIRDAARPSCENRGARETPKICTCGWWAGCLMQPTSKQADKHCAQENNNSTNIIRFGELFCLLSLNYSSKNCMSCVLCTYHPPTSYIHSNVCLHLHQVVLQQRHNTHSV